MNAITQLKESDSIKSSSTLLINTINQTTISALNILIDNIYQDKIDGSKNNPYYPNFIVETWIEILKHTKQNLKQTFIDIFVENKYVWKLQFLELIDFFSIELVQNWWYKNTKFSLEDVFNIIKELKVYSKVLEIFSQHYVKVTKEDWEYIEVEYLDLDKNLQNVSIKK